MTSPPETGARSRENVGAGHVVLPRWAEVALWVAIAAPFLARASIVVRANWNWFVQRLPDDGFYYLEIGRNLGAGDGSTFDGVNATNGYHPLWQWIVAVLSVPFDDDLAFVRAVVLVQLALVLAAVVVVVGIVRRAAGAVPALLGGVVAASSMLVVGAGDAMEGAVVVLVLAVVARRLEIALTTGRRRDVVLVGVAAAVLVLARLDLVLVVWALPVALWRGAAPDVRRRAPLDWLAGAALVGVPYGAWHLIRWGQPATTSASIKQHWVSSSAEESFGGRFSGGYLDFVVERGVDYVESLARGLTQLATARELVVWGLLVLAAVGLWQVTGARRARLLGRGSGPATAALTTVGIMVLAKAGIDLVSSPSWAAGWYSAPQRLAFPLLVGALAGCALLALARRSSLLAWALGAAVVVACLAGGLSRATFDPREGLRDGLWQVEVERAAGWILAEGPTGRYGARDAGLLGFRLHGERTVVNLDGLVNDEDFADLVRADAPLRERVQDQEVDVLVNRLSPEDRATWDDCAVELYRSEVRISSYDPLLGGSVASPYYVLDVRSCRR